MFIRRTNASRLHLQVSPNSKEGGAYAVPTASFPWRSQDREREERDAHVRARRVDALARAHSLRNCVLPCVKAINQAALMASYYK